MPTIIIDRAIADSSFAHVEKDNAEVGANDIILPLAVYLEHRDELKDRKDVGVWIDAHEEVEEIADFVHELPVIALNFPSFFDGRSLSSANILRRRYGYTGELRAIGDVRRDQLDQMQRCGINAFQLAEGQDIRKALSSLSSFSYNYQSSIDRPEPLFRQR